MPKSEEFLLEDIVNLIKQLSSDSKVSISENQAHKLLIISILVDNEELFSEIIDNFPKETNEINIDIFIEQIQLIDSLSRLNQIRYFNLRRLIDKIYSNFYLIDENKMKERSKPLLLEILRNKKLRNKNEDCLYDFIESIENKSSPKQEEEGENSCSIEFYEQIFISKLNEDEFKQLLLHINPSEMTTTFWQHICSRICEIKFKEDIPLNRYSANLEKSKKERVYAQTAIVGQHLVIESNNKAKDLSLDSSLHQSFSAYGYHTVKVTSGGSLMVIGDNSCCQFIEFCLRDSNVRLLTSVSAACYECGSLYMMRKSGGFGNQLVLCDQDINGLKFFLIQVIRTQCYFWVVIIMKQRSTATVKLSLSIVIQSKIHHHHVWHHFHFPMVRYDRLSRAVPTQSLF